MVRTFATSLDADEADALVGDEVVERADGVAPAADTRDDRVRQPTDLRVQLLLDLLPDDALEVAHDRGEGVRPDGGAVEVVCDGQVRDPVAHGLVHGVLQCLRARSDRDDLREN